MTLGQSSPGRDMKARFFYLGLLMLAGLLVLIVNLYRLQIIRGDEFFAKSEDNRFKDVRIRAERGLIKDRRGEILVDGRPSFDLFITPAFCQKCAVEVLPKLASWLRWDEMQMARVESQLKAAHGTQRFQPMPVHVDLSRDELDLVLAHLPELPGVETVTVQHRNYRSGTVLAHVLGYMNEITQDELDNRNRDSAGERPRYALGDYVGRRGIERYFELRKCGDANCGLRGLDGWTKELVNARGEGLRDQMGRVIRQDESAPTSGNNVILSIDSRLQAEAERAFPGTAGAVVALDVNTGFVLAMVSRPAYDPNLLTGRVTPAKMAALAKDPLQPMIFRPVAQHYSPGSTFKLVTLLAALESPSFNPNTTVHCPGGYRLGSRYWRCHKDSGHGTVAAEMALKVSCDTYFYRVADVIGIDPIAKMGKALGLGRPTGIGVVAEVPGIMPDTAYHDRVTPGGYTKGMALNTAIGQGDDNVTPLQLAVVYATVANGGTVYQPQLVRRIEAPDGKILEEFQPKVTRQVELHEPTRRVAMDAMIAVVNEPGGTAYRSRLKDIVVAGKTGTAQVSRLGSVRLKKEQMAYFLRDHAWFAAVAPAEAPEIAVVVLNEHGGHGGSDAAPTAAAVIQKYFDLKAEDSGVPVPKTANADALSPKSLPRPPGVVLPPPPTTPPAQEPPLLLPPPPLPVPSMPEERGETLAAPVESGRRMAVADADEKRREPRAPAPPKRSTGKGKRR